MRGRSKRRRGFNQCQCNVSQFTSFEYKLSQESRNGPELAKSSSSARRRMCVKHTQRKKGVVTTAEQLLCSSDFFLVCRQDDQEVCTNVFRTFEEDQHNQRTFQTPKNYLFSPLKKSASVSETFRQSLMSSFHV